MRRRMHQSWRLFEPQASAVRPKTIAPRPLRSITRYAFILLGESLRPPAQIIINIIILRNF